MAEQNVNPLRKSIKHVLTGGRNLRQNVRRQNEESQKEARGEIVRMKRNIVEDSSHSKNGKQASGIRADKRREELLAWKAKRDRLKKVEVRKRVRQGEFIVKHVKYSPPKYLVGGNDTAVSKKENGKTIAHKKPRSSARLAEKREKAMNKTEKKCATAVSMNGDGILSKNEHGVKRRMKGSNKCVLDGAENDDKKKSEKLNINLERCFQSKEETVGFVFLGNPDGVIPKTFNFGERSAIMNFSSSALGLQDPIAAFNESLKHGSDGIPDKSTSARHSFILGVSEDPIAKFNASLKSEGKGSTEGFISIKNNSMMALESPKTGQTQMPTRTPRDNDASSDIVLRESEMLERKQLVIRPDANQGHKSEESPTHMLRCTPQRSTYHAKVLAAKNNMTFNESLESKSGNKTRNAIGSEMNENPRRTPIKPNAISLLQETKNDGFTPRRIKSTMYFKDLLVKERDNFTRNNESWTVYLETEELPEEVKGDIRTVIGQANLLMDQRFAQFEQLIQVHQRHQQQQGATASDLQGFWDMISYQIEDVHQKYKLLEKRKQNNWVVEEESKENVKTKRVIERKIKESKKLIARQEETKKFKKLMRARMQKFKNNMNEDGVIISADSGLKVAKSSDADGVECNSVKKHESSSRSRSSTDEMSTDSLEEEVNTKKLCAQLENVKLKCYQTGESNSHVSPLKEVGNNRTYHKEEDNSGNDSLFGLGFSCSPRKVVHSFKFNESDVSLMKFD